MFKCYDLIVGEVVEGKDYDTIFKVATARRNQYNGKDYQREQGTHLDAMIMKDKDNDNIIYIINTKR